jgi:hypothetical protein
VARAEEDVGPPLDEFLAQRKAGVDRQMEKKLRFLRELLGI